MSFGIRPFNIGWCFNSSRPIKEQTLSISARLTVKLVSIGLMFLIFFFTTTVGAHVESFVSSTLFLYYCAHTVKMQMYNRPKFETEDEDAEKLLPVTLLFSRPYCMLF